MPEEGKKSTMNYVGNTHKARDKPENIEKKKIERVTTSEVVTRKKPLSRKIAETFTGDDMHGVGSYVLFDIMLPTFKSMISDVVSQGIERMLFGDSRPRSSVGSRSNYTSYNRYSTSKREEPRQVSQRARQAHDFREVILETRGEAEEVLERLSDLVQQYEVATVSDLYELVGITGSFTDDKWGWTDLRGAGIRRVRDGYLMDLPRTAPID